MTMTYQQQFVLDGLAGRAAILNLDARHNRLYSVGDLAGWITTFRHAGATYTRAGESFTDLRDAFDGGNGVAAGDRRPRDHGGRCRRNAEVCRTAVPRQRTSGLRHLYRPAHLRAWWLVLHVARTRMGPRAARERAAGVTTDFSYEFAFGTYEDALRMVGTRTEPRFAGTAVSGARIQHFASMVRDPNPSYWDSDFAGSVWGGLVAPPALLIGLSDAATVGAHRRTAHGVDRGPGSASRAPQSSTHPTTPSI